MSNKQLNTAKDAKNDEFYTQKSDIEEELRHYKTHFKGKVVYCNCDDPDWSEFALYFRRRFTRLGLKKLICTHYEPDGKPSYKLEMTDKNLEEYIRTPLEGNGDFRSEECIRLLDEADVVVTNPPFSLFREYIGTLLDHNKQFLIIGNLNAVTYKEVFPHILAGDLWMGATCFHGGATYFVGNAALYDPVKMSNPKHAYVEGDKLYWRVNGVRWFTNMDHKHRHEQIDLVCQYHSEEYHKYDGYDAINVDKVSDIPQDYLGVMGVPISFLDKYCPEQFEIVGTIGAGGEYNVGPSVIDGTAVYKRILIRRRDQPKIENEESSAE